MKIAILVCYNPTLVNFRLDLMLEMIRLGHQDRVKIEVNAREFAAILNGIKPEKYYKRFFRKKN